MRHPVPASLAAAVFVAVIFFVTTSARAATATDPSSYVNPMIGTSGNGFDGGIDDFPAADAPFGMIQWGPDTTSHQAGGGYLYGDSAITGFSLDHVSGPGCNVFGDVGILPTVGAVTDPASASQPFSHASEVARPGYYSVIVGMPSIRSRLTVTPRTGLGSFSFPAVRLANVLVNASSDQAGVIDSQFRIVGDRDIVGSAISGNFCGMPGWYTVYFALHFNRAFIAHGTWLLKKVMPGTEEASGAGVGGWVTFDAVTDPTVKVKTSLSWVSIAGAEANLAAEGTSWNVDDVRRATAAQWSSELGRVRVDGGTEKQKRIFYTALYHAMLHPNIFNDVDGSYRGFDGQVHRVAPGHMEYATFSGWDIYRTVIPLDALLDPKRTSDMMRSLVDAANQMGWLPKWSLVNVETGVMGGDPSDPMIASAFAFGARDFDARAALAAMVKGASQVDGPRGQGWYYQRPGLDDYLARGYVTNDHQTNVSNVPNGASLTLEYAQDDFSIAQFARSLGDQDTFRAMMGRAQNWSNIFDRTTGLIAPRGPDGAFIYSPMRDSGQSGFQEGNAAQYTWMVPQNLAGLIDGMGGRPSAVAKLDTFFTQIDAGGWSVPYAWMGNEPSIGSPWVYLSAGAPWKAQRVIRDTMTQLWGDTPDGIPGNDDLGTMSAWYVWCALGLYPQNPAAPVLDVGTPLFTHVSIHVPGGASIAIDAPNASTSNAYVQSIRVDGKLSSKSWVPFEPGRPMHLSFAVGDTPNQHWAIAPSDSPPSYALGPVRFPPTTLASIMLSSPDVTLGPGGTSTLQFGVANAGDAPASISWNIDVPAGLSLSPSSGTIAAAPGASPRVETRLSVATSAQSGLYDLSIAGQTDNGALVPRVTAAVRVSRRGEILSLGYVANAGANSVTPIDGRTRAYGAPITVGSGPRDVALSPNGRRLFVANEGSNDVSVVDTSTQAVVATVKVGSAPWGVLVDPSGATAWVANHGDNTIQPIDIATLSAGAPIAVGLQPEGLAITPDGATLYVSDQGSNDVTPVDLRRRTTLAPIAVGLRPRGIAVAADGKTVVVANQGSDSITAIDVATGAASPQIPAGSGPRRVVVSPDGKLAYAADASADTVTPIDLLSRTARAPIIVGESPYALVFDASGSTLYVVTGGQSRCVAVNIQTGSVGNPIRVGDSPLAIAR